jgi:hypothetical protein
MIPVAFPYIESTFKKALSEVVTPYLTGGAGSVGGVLMDFYSCELHWNIDAVKSPSIKPRVCITGSRSEKLDEWKCTNPIIGGPPISYMMRYSIYRSVYVSAPKSLQISSPPLAQPKRPIGWEDMDRIWSQLHAVLATKHTDLLDRNIYRPSLIPTPVIAHDEEYFILYGAFSCEVRVMMARG